MKRTFAVTLSLSLLARAALAETSGRETLRGVVQVSVLVEGLSHEAEVAGLTAQLLKTDIELRLRHSRVALSDSDDESLLCFRVAAEQLADGRRWAYTVLVSYRQPVTLVRNKAWCVAETWHAAGVIALASPAKFVQTVRSHVGNVTDEFIGDYLAMNSNSP